MTVTAPDVSEWWDAAAVTAAALAVLRLQSGDVDAGRVAALVPTAGQRINQRLDRVTPYTTSTAPPELVDGIVQAVIELYRRKDAPPAGVDGALFGAWRPPSVDPLAGVYALIDPYRERRGVG